MACLSRFGEFHGWIWGNLIFFEMGLGRSFSTFSREVARAGPGPPGRYIVGRVRSWYPGGMSPERPPQLPARLAVPDLERRIREIQTETRLRLEESDDPQKGSTSTRHMRPETQALVKLAREAMRARHAADTLRRAGVQ